MNDDKPYFEGLADQEIPEPTSESAELTKASTALEKHKTEEAVFEGGEEGTLTVDVYHTPSEIVVESAIAGVAPDAIDVDVSRDSVTIKGSRRREKKVRDEDYLYQECYWGKFGRSIILPQEVDPEGADVTFKNGILTIRLPKLNDKKSRKLKVKVE